MLRRVTPYGPFGSTTFKAQGYLVGSNHVFANEDMVPGPRARNVGGTGCWLSGAIRDGMPSWTAWELGSGHVEHARARDP